MPVALAMVNRLRSYWSWYQTQCLTLVVELLGTEVGLVWWHH